MRGKSVGGSISGKGHDGSSRESKAVSEGTKAKRKRLVDAHVTLAGTGNLSPKDAFVKLAPHTMIEQQHVPTTSRRRYVAP